MAGTRHLLLLGGTTEAAELARALAARTDVAVTVSLAGATGQPAVLPGGQRRGGFGGPVGLAAYLDQAGVDVVVDATHPFARVMRWNAAEAAAAAGVPRLRLERPPWTATPDDRWWSAADLAEAAGRVAASPARRVFVTTGRRDLDAFVPAVAEDRWWLVRCIEAPDPMPLQPGEVVLDRGPFGLDGELDLLDRHRIDLLVTKNSGGSAVGAKLQAARSRGLPVVMVQRPPSPPGPGASSVEAALAWLDGPAQDPDGPAG